MPMRFSYRIAPSNAHSVIISTCKPIWKKLWSLELLQHTETVWRKIAEEFYSIWQFLNCIGAADRERTEIQAIRNSVAIILKITSRWLVCTENCVRRTIKWTYDSRGCTHTNISDDEIKVNKLFWNQDV